MKKRSFIFDEINSNINLLLCYFNQQTNKKHKAPQCSFDLTKSFIWTFESFSSGFLNNSKTLDSFCISHFSVVILNRSLSISSPTVCFYKFHQQCLNDFPALENQFYGHKVSQWNVQIKKLETSTYQERDIFHRRQTNRKKYLIDFSIQFPFVRKAFFELLLFIVESFLNELWIVVVPQRRYTSIKSVFVCLSKRSKKLLSSLKVPFPSSALQQSLTSTIIVIMLFSHLNLNLCLREAFRSQIVVGNFYCRVTFNGRAQKWITELLGKTKNAFRITFCYGRWPLEKITKKSSSSSSLMPHKVCFMKYSIVLFSMWSGF